MNWCILRMIGLASLHCCFIAFVILLHCIRNIASLHCCFIALVILLCNASLVYCHICFIALLHCWSHPLLNNNVSQNTIHFCSPPIAALYICILFYYARHRTKISNNKKKGPSRKQACLWLSWDYIKIISTHKSSNMIVNIPKYILIDWLIGLKMCWWKKMTNIRYGR